MASSCNRFISRTSSLRSALKYSVNRSSPSTPPRFPLPSRSPVSPARRFSLSSTPSELGCVQSLLPLHSAVAVARMTSCLSVTSRTCRSLSQELGLSVPR